MSSFVPSSHTYSRTPHLNGADGELTEELRKYLLAKGANLVGFGAVELMEGAPDIMRPDRYLPDAQTMISIGLLINEASCDLVARSVRKRNVPASYHSYQLFTLTLINPQLDQLAYHGAKFLERRGFRAYPFPANVPNVLKPTEQYPGGPGDISHKHVDVACGLGQIGWHTMLMTPGFAPRQKLTSSGNYDLYIRRSSDKGQTWSDPAAITNDPLEDFIFSFRIARDGTRILLWEQHDASVRGGLLGKSADIYLSTSTNGVDWKPPKLLTPESGKPETDTIPSLIEGPGGQIYAVWITTRLSGGPTVVGVPVWPKRDLSDCRRVPAEGYSVRGQALGDGRYLLAWVKTVSRSNHDYFYRILDGFDFDAFKPVLP